VIPPSGFSEDVLTEQPTINLLERACILRWRSWKWSYVVLFYVRKILLHRIKDFMIYKTV